MDMLVKTFLKDGKEEWVLIHIEIEGGNDMGFSRRMFMYWYRIYDRFGVDIAALVVFTGNKYQKRSEVFEKEFLGTKVHYSFNTYHILDHSEEELLKMDNPFALIVLAAQKALLRDRIPEQELGEQRLTVARALIQSHKYSHEQIINFLYFLKNFIYIENPVINRNFDREIEVLTGKENAMGIIETIKKITREEAILEERKKRKLEMAKRNQEIAKNLKKAGVDLNIIAKSTGLSVEDIRKL